MYTLLVSIAPLFFGLLFGFSVGQAFKAAMKRDFVEVFAWTSLAVLAFVYALYVAIPEAEPIWRGILKTG